MRKTKMIKESTLQTFRLTKNNVLRRKYPQKKERSLAVTFLLNPRNVSLNWNQ